MADTSSARSVAAVVVTHNRAVKLRQTLDAIVSQRYPVARLIIVDNASSDGTEELLAEWVAKYPSSLVLRLAENTGGAGGFAEGVRLGYQSGQDYLWLMDDDCYPEPGALEKLVNTWEDFEQVHGIAPGFVCSLVKWREQTCEMNIPEPSGDFARYFESGRFHVIAVDHSSFVSVMFKRQRVAEVGLPIREFFIWFDDVEYTTRLAAERPGLLVLDSQVQHDMEHNTGADFGLVTAQTLWKYRYGARNKSYYYRQQGLIPWLEYLVFANHRLNRNKVPLRLRLAINMAIFRGLLMRVKIEYVQP